MQSIARGHSHGASLSGLMAPGGRNLHGVVVRSASERGWKVDVGQQAPCPPPQADCRCPCGVWRASDLLAAAQAVGRAAVQTGTHGAHRWGSGWYAGGPMAASAGRRPVSCWAPQCLRASGVSARWGVGPVMWDGVFIAPRRCAGRSMGAGGRTTLGRFCAVSPGFAPVWCCHRPASGGASACAGRWLSAVVAYAPQVVAWCPDRREAGAKCGRTVRR